MDGSEVITNNRTIITHRKLIILEETGAKDQTMCPVLPSLAYMCHLYI